MAKTHANGDCTTASSSTADHLEDESSNQSDCETLFRQLDSSLQDEDWVNGDADDQGYQLLSDEDIIHQVTSQPRDDTPENNEEDETEDSEIPNSGEVAEMLDNCLLWYERQEESTASSLLLLKRIRDLAATKRFTNLKQLTIDSFFT